MIHCDGCGRDYEEIMIEVTGGLRRVHSCADADRADRYWQALVDIAGLEGWQKKEAGDIARAALSRSVVEACP